jgi:hypothetical protein
MSQDEINRAVARVTGENIAVIESRGFTIADPHDVSFDPELRRPMVLDWDTMTAEELRR